MTPERLKIYAGDLVDLDQRSLANAFQRARRERRFFPKIAEIRELASISRPEEQDEVEAQAAFQAVIRSLERNGADAGIRHLPERVQYAVRQCGGLFQFNQRLQIRYGDDENPSLVDNRSPIFLQQDFVKAYKAFTVHKAMLPELTEKGLLALPPKVRAFLKAGHTAETEPMEEANTRAPRPRKIPEPMTDAQIRDRRELLNQQSASLAAKAANARRF